MIKLYTFDSIKNCYKKYSSNSRNATISNIVLSKFILLFIFFVFAINVSAQEKYTSNIPLEQEYLDSFSEPVEIKKTLLYKKGIELLYLRDLYVDKAFKGKTNKDDLKFKMPDYPKALQYFLESSYKENNLASAFMAGRVLEFLGDLNSNLKNQILYLSQMQKLATKNNCKGLERVAAYYYYGKGGLTIDKKTGIKMAKKASKICSNTDYIYPIFYLINKETK